MGTYTDYDEGNMIIPKAAFPKMQEALPRLAGEKYHISQEDLAKALAKMQEYYKQQREKDKDDHWANQFFSLPEKTQTLLAQLSMLAHTSWNNFFISYGTETIEGEDIEGLTISFDSVKNWSPELLHDLAPFLYPESYIQVGGDVDVCRYVARNGQIECIYPSW